MASEGLLCVVVCVCPPALPFYVFVWWCLTGQRGEAFRTLSVRAGLFLLRPTFPAVLSDYKEVLEPCCLGTMKQTFMVMEKTTVSKRW